MDLGWWGVGQGTPKPAFQQLLVDAAACSLALYFDDPQEALETWGNSQVIKPGIESLDLCPPPALPIGLDDDESISFMVGWSRHGYYVVACRGPPGFTSVGVGTAVFQHGVLGRAHQGYLDSVETVPLAFFLQLIQRGQPIVFTGHSLGGAMAALLTLRIVTLVTTAVASVRCVTFGAPLFADDLLAGALRTRLHGTLYNVISKEDGVLRILNLAALSGAYPDNLLKCLGEVGLAFTYNGKLIMAEAGWPRTPQLLGEAVNMTARVLGQRIVKLNKASTDVQKAWNVYGLCGLFIILDPPNQTLQLLSAKDMAREGQNLLMFPLNTPSTAISSSITIDPRQLYNHRMEKYAYLISRYVENLQEEANEEGRSDDTIKIKETVLVPRPTLSNVTISDWNIPDTLRVSFKGTGLSALKKSVMSVRRQRKKGETVEVIAHHVVGVTPAGNLRKAPPTMDWPAVGKVSMPVHLHDRSDMSIPRSNSSPNIIIIDSHSSSNERRRTRPSVAPSPDHPTSAGGEEGQETAVLDFPLHATGVSTMEAILSGRMCFVFSFGLCRTFSVRNVEWEMSALVALAAAMHPLRDEAVRRHTLQDWLGSWGATVEAAQGTKRAMKDYVFCALELLALSSPLARQNLQALEANQKLAPMLPFLRYALTPACWWKGKSHKVAESILSTESPQLFALLRSSERFLSSVVSEMESPEAQQRLSYEVLLPWMSALKREMSYDWNSYETLRELDIGKLPSTENLRNLTLAVKLLYKDGFLALPSSAIVIPYMPLPSSHTVVTTRRKRAAAQSATISSEDDSPKSHRFLLPGKEFSEYHKKFETENETKEQSELSSQLNSAEQEPRQEDGVTFRALVERNLSKLKALSNFIPSQKTPPNSSPATPSQDSFKEQATSTLMPMRSSPSILAAASEELNRWAEILEPELKGTTIRRIEHYTSFPMQAYGGDTSHVTSHVEQSTHMPSDAQHTAPVHPLEIALEEEFRSHDPANHSPRNGDKFEEDKPSGSEVNTGMQTPNKTSPKAEEDMSSVPPSRKAELLGARRPSLTRFGIEELAMQQGSPNWSPPRTSSSGLPQFSPIRVRTPPIGSKDVENNAAAPWKESLESTGDVTSAKEERQIAEVESPPVSAPLSPPVTQPVSPPKPPESPVAVSESPRYFQMPLSSPRYVRQRHSAFCDRPRVQPPGSPRGPVVRESVLLQLPSFNESDHGSIGPDVPFAETPKQPSKSVLVRKPTPRRGVMVPFTAENLADNNISSAQSSREESTPTLLLPSPPLSSLEETPPPPPQPTPGSQETKEQSNLNSRRYLHPSQETSRDEQPISSGTLSSLPSTDLARLPSLPPSSMQEPLSPLPQPKRVALKTCSPEGEEVCDDESLISAMGSVGLGFGPPPEIWIFRSPNSPRSPGSAESERGVRNVVWDSAGPDRGASSRDFQNGETEAREADESASSLAPVRTQRVLTRTWSTGETPEKMSWIWSTGAFSPAVPKEKPRNRSPPLRPGEAVPDQQTLSKKNFSRSQTWSSTPTIRDVPEQDVDVSQTFSAESGLGGLGVEPKWERSLARKSLPASSKATAEDKVLTGMLSSSSDDEAVAKKILSRTWSNASMPGNGKTTTAPILLRQNTWSPSSSQSGLQGLPETQSHKASAFNAVPQTGSTGSDQETMPEQVFHAQSAESNGSPTGQHKPLSRSSPTFVGAREQQPSASGDVEEHVISGSASSASREEVPQPKLLWRSWSAAIRQEAAPDGRALNRSWSKAAEPIAEPAPELQSQQRSIAQVKVPDGLIRLLGHVYLFKACSSREEVLRTSMELKAQDEGASVVVLNVHGPDGPRSSETEERHRITVVDYPPLYGGSAVLPLELTIAFIGLCNSCIVKGELIRMVVLHCEPGGWLVLAFLISVLFTCLGNRPDPEKTLLSVLSDLPSRLRSGKSEISPFPSQLRYLQYVVSGVREVITKRLIVKGVVLHHIPTFLIDQGGRSVVRFYGRHLDAQGKLQEGILYSSDCKAPSRLDNPAKEMVETNCQLSGDIVLDCIIRQYGMEDNSREAGGLPRWLAEEQLIFRAVFNTAFYREGKPLELRTDDVDRPWGGHRLGLSSAFRAELWFRELTSRQNTTKTL